MRQRLKQLLRKLIPLTQKLLILGVVYWGAAKLGRALPGALLVRVAPWEVAVRQDDFGGGLEQNDLKPGSYIQWPGLTSIQAVDMRGRLTMFSSSPWEDQGAAIWRPALDIRTSGNQTAQVELGIAWHIQSGAAHKLVGAALLSSLPSKVADKCEGSLQTSLAAFSSEDWFDARKRAELSEGLRQQLAAEVADFFVVIDGVYIHGVRFSADFEVKLQEKQVAHQMALLHDANGHVEEAQAKVAKMNAETQSIIGQRVAEWEQTRKTSQIAFNLEMAALEAETDSYVSRVKAEVGAEYTRVLADGQQAVKLASQEAEQMRLNALDGAGGRIWLAREAAGKLDVREVWLDSRDARVPSMLDLGELVELLMGPGE